TLRQRPGLHGKQADADRLVLSIAGIGSAPAIAVLARNARRPSLTDIISSRARVARAVNSLPGILGAVHGNSGVGKQHQLGRYMTSRIFCPATGSRGNPVVSAKDPHISPL